MRLVLRALVPDPVRRAAEADDGEHEDAVVTSRRFVVKRSITCRVMCPNSFCLRCRRSVRFIRYS